MIVPLTINVRETIECNLSVILVIQLYLGFVQFIFVKFSAIFRPDESIRPIEFRPNGFQPNEHSARRVSAKQRLAQSHLLGRYLMVNSEEKIQKWNI
jgi:hypothetical protein